MNTEKWSELTEHIRNFMDSGIRSILGDVTVDPITGYAYILSQLREIFIMAVCGAAIAFFFEVYEGLYASHTGGKKRIHENTFRAVWDFFFCVAAALIAARFWYISSCGRISFHETAALIAGIFIGRTVFVFKNSKPVRALAAVYVIMLITAYIVIS